MWRPRAPLESPAACLLVAAALSGCASGHLSQELRKATIEAVEQRGLDPSEIVIPFDLDDEMRSWVHEEVSTSGRPLERLSNLLQALLSRRSGGLTYERNHTATAQEVWRGGVANCLSFTHLFVGLARELDVPVYYLRVSDLQHFEKDGDLVVASEHVTAAYGPASRRRILDFSEQENYDYHLTRQISDITAIALYYSNLGAGRIRDGDTEGALELLVKSIRLDPELADGWVNYGVALRRLGRPDEAESAFRRALEADPRMTSAYNNLASLLERSGRAEEAKGLLELTDRHANRNPFSYLALGDLSFREGRIDEAERYYRRAQRLNPQSAEAFAALGQVALAGGDRRQAERWLRKARSADPESQRAADLARSLGARPQGH